MDSSLCFTVTLVALAWLSVSTFAQDTTTASPNTTLAITATAASNTTTVATVTTAPPPLVFNNTVTPLEVGTLNLLKAHEKGAFNELKVQYFVFRQM